MNTLSSLSKMYLITAGCCVLIGAYLFFINGAELGSPGQSCYFVYLFGIPCAVCGGNHAIQEMMRGRWFSAFQFNPLAFLIICLTLLISLILTYDFFFKKTIWLKFFSRGQSILREKKFSYSLALLLIIHWFFNAIKYMKG
ncbi:MAG: DUF2752 domain-containing protein [Saprospiraceae bacterium]|nr:DUF2752 domain-containing protein [Saprospiraceae bacterium]